MATQCHGTTAAGARCKKQTSDTSGYCHMHAAQAPAAAAPAATMRARPATRAPAAPPTPPVPVSARAAPRSRASPAQTPLKAHQCRGHTKTGDACRRMTTNVSGFCTQHAMVTTPPPAPDDVRPRGERCGGVNKNGSQCRNTTRSADGFCATHAGQAGGRHVVVSEARVLPFTVTAGTAASGSGAGAHSGAGTVVQCNGTTTTGSQCKHTTTHDSGMCPSHRPLAAREGAGELSDRASAAGAPHTRAKEAARSGGSGVQVLAIGSMQDIEWDAGVLALLGRDSTKDVKTRATPRCSYCRAKTHNAATCSAKAEDDALARAHAAAGADVLVGKRRCRYCGEDGAHRCAVETVYEDGFCREHREFADRADIESDDDGAGASRDRFLDSTWSPLSRPKDDCLKVAHLFESRGGAANTVETRMAYGHRGGARADDTEDGQTWLGPEGRGYSLTKRRVEAEVSACFARAAARRCRLVVLYYSGHGEEGLSNARQKGAWALEAARGTRSRPGVPAFAYFTFDELRRMWVAAQETLPADARLLVVSDCCYSGKWVAKLRALRKADQAGLNMGIQSGGDARQYVVERESTHGGEAFWNGQMTAWFCAKNAAGRRGSAGRGVRWSDGADHKQYAQYYATWHGGTQGGANELDLVEYVPGGLFFYTNAR